MKVMQILPKVNVGGVERGVLDLIKHFKDSSEVSNIVVSGGGKLLSQIEQAQVLHYTLPVHRKSPLSLFLISDLVKIIRQEKVDIVHARSRVPGWLSFFASRITGTPFVTTAHGVYKNKQWSEVMAWGKFVICPSKYVARYMLERYNIPEEKIVVIPRWVDLNHFHYSDYRLKQNSNLIVSVGRITPSKGYEYLIEAFKKVVRLNPYMKLKIVGPQDKSKTKYYDLLKTLVSKYSLHYNVQFEGFSSNIEGLLRNASMLVAPSVTSESFGRVIVEAFACGVPVIATDVGAYPEVIEDNVDGLIVPSQDSQALADKILWVMNNPHQAQIMAQTARKKVETLFTMDKALEATKQVYLNTLKQTRILVIKLSAFGDLILIIPALRRLKEQFPNSTISLLTMKQYSSFFYDCPYIDEIVTLDQGYKTIKSVLTITTSLRRKSFDYIVDLQNSHTSHWISFLTFSRKSFGYDRKLGFLLSVKAKFIKHEKIDPLTSQEKVLKFLGIQFAEKKLEFWPAKPRDISHLGLPDKNIIGINVSASKKWATKNWPIWHIKSFIELAQKTLPSYKIALIGDAQSFDQAQAIETSLKHKVINLCGKTSIRDLVDVLNKIDLFITPDTATMHLSCALGVNTIGLFGPTDPDQHSVKSQTLSIIHNCNICKPCYKGCCVRKKVHACMESITPAEVLEKTISLINNQTQKNNS